MDRVRLQLCSKSKSSILFSAGCSSVRKRDIERPKQRGGLGFRKFEDINKAFVAKLAWDMASNADKL
ncbi:hypothetical protein G4B88_006993 [Cannabis sativa]|uniref:Uncharacterized protein n=1 Tax=Cannabis sativa TaxID=3483 RepID=A0A7J6FQV1_CANSA|nr:hypothetical protein G4B88_006993 [Cannabis sativa]